MFKEAVTQYCPMCQEWASKYEELKSENKSLKNQLKYEFDETLLQYSNRLDELHKTLTEIKEIATCCIEGDVARIRMKQILQKISECEVNDEN